MLTWLSERLDIIVLIFCGIKLASIFVLWFHIIIIVVLLRVHGVTQCDWKSHPLGILLCLKKTARVKTELC